MAVDSRWILKIVLCGPSLVGKTCLCTRYVDGVFAGHTKKTIGVDFALKNMTLEPEPGKNITLQLWDFAGEARFKNVLPMYIGGTRGLLLSFDLSEPETLGELPQWLEVIRPCIDDSVPIVLIGMKSDLEQKTSQEEIDHFLKKEGIEHFMACSSLTGTNVEETFVLITHAVVRQFSTIQ